MKNTYIYLGVGAIALIGAFMYFKNRNMASATAPDSKSNDSESSETGTESSETTQETTNTPDTKKSMPRRTRPLSSPTPPRSSSSSSVRIPSGIMPNYSSNTNLGKPSEALAQAFKDASQTPSTTQLSGASVNCEIEAIKKFGVNWRNNPNSYLRNDHLAWFEKCSQGQLGTAPKQNFVPFYSVEEETFAFNGHTF